MLAAGSGLALAPTSVRDSTSRVMAKQTDPRNEALEAALATSRDPGLLAQYGEWLRATGSVRGQLAALDGASGARIDEFVRAHGAELLGGLAPHVGRAVHAWWAHGFIRQLALRSMGPVGGPSVGHVAQLVAKIPKLASARFLSSLRLGRAANKRLPAHDGWDPERTHTRSLHALSRALPCLPRLTSLSLDDYDRDFMAHELDDAPGEVARFWAAAAGLVALTVRARRFLAPSHAAVIAWPAALERLCIEAQSGHDRVIASLLGASWPRLTHLDLWLPGMATRGVDISSLLARDRLPALTHLGLELCVDADALAEALATSSLAPQLTSLSLAGGALTMRGARALTGGLPRLERLDVSECTLDADACAVVVGLAPSVSLLAQRSPDRTLRDCMSDAIFTSSLATPLGPLGPLHELAVRAGWPVQAGPAVSGGFGTTLLSRPRAAQPE